MSVLTKYLRLICFKQLSLLSRGVLLGIHSLKETWLCDADFIVQAKLEVNENISTSALHTTTFDSSVFYVMSRRYFDR